LFRYLVNNSKGGRDLRGTADQPKNLRTAPQSKDQTLTRYYIPIIIIIIIISIAAIFKFVMSNPEVTQPWRLTAKMASQCA